MKINSNIVKAAEVYAKAYMDQHLDRRFLFHDVSHTVCVVEGVKTLCDAAGTSKHEKKALVVAAWFHDLGYTDRINQHEDIGALLAEKFLHEYNVDEKDIEAVKKYIVATHYPQKPQSLEEMILCDADMMHLADKNYMERSDVLRKEWASTRNDIYTDEDWLELNIKFLSDHCYHTEYCKDKTEAGKRKNIKKLMALRDPEEENNNSLQIIATSSEKKKDKKKSKYEYGRGVETLFRIAANNHMRLSGMADNKAHILLSINSIIISVVLSVLAKKLTESNFLILPTAILLCVCLASIVFAVLTTRPKVPRKGFTLDQVNNKEVNLLFFGNFHHLEPETYESGIGEMMKDKEYLYKTLTKDVYYLGKVLAVKYKYLNIGYMIFMCGIIGAVLSFGVSFAFN